MSECPTVPLGERGMENQVGDNSGRSHDEDIRRWRDKVVELMRALESAKDEHTAAQATIAELEKKLARSSASKLSARSSAELKIVEARAISAEHRAAMAEASMREEQTQAQERIAALERQLESAPSKEQAGRIVELESQLEEQQLSIASLQVGVLPSIR